ncbi:MAG: DoxX family protein [Hyphomonadaceae bacterium]
MLSNLSARAPLFLSVLRIVAALGFMQHGLQKLFNFPPGERGPVENWLSFPVGIAGILETFGGALLLIGLFTRPVAFILSGMMAVAYWMAHAPQSPYPILNGGELAMLYCFTFLYFVFAGGGSLSADALLGRKPAAAAA